MGEIVFFTVTKPANFFSSGKKEGVLSLMMKIINSMKKEGITEEEIRNAKGYIKGSNVLNLESLTTQTQYNGEEWLMGGNVQKIVPYSKLYETYYHNITKADLTRVINQYIIPQNMCVCIVNSKPLSLDKVKHDCETLI
jgi:predicted Zn-dependent peptidase